MKVIIVMGTRPEVIKLAPVVKALLGKVNLCVCTTGQHREMLLQALSSFSIEPDIQLDCMSPGSSLNILSSRLLAMIDDVLDREVPDWVVVQGDTTSAFCAGLAAFHRGINVAHVEAGLRTGDIFSPFPEEANRRLLTRISTLHCAPTRVAADALIKEGINPKTVFITGNTVVDSIVQARKTWNCGIPRSLPSDLSEFISAQPFVLITCHRRENFGTILEGICSMIRNLCGRYPEFGWVFPVHLNPAVRKPVYRILGSIPNLLLTDPVDYHTSLYLISRAVLALSDSGGIQEEAPSFGTPVVVMRRHTERMEGVNAGFATLAGQDPVAIEAAIDAWLVDGAAREKLKSCGNPYGDGKASERIAALIQGKDIEPFNE